MLPQRTISPEAAQANARTLFVVHLDFGALPTAAPDNNCRSDVMDAWMFEPVDPDNTDDGGFIDPL